MVGLRVGKEYIENKWVNLFHANVLLSMIFSILQKFLQNTIKNWNKEEYWYELG